MKNMLLTMTAALSIAGAAQANTIVDFDDLTLPSNESYYNGSDGAAGFQSGPAYFVNNYNSTYQSWDGYSYSNMSDTTTTGFGNQYSAITGSGAGAGDDNYAVAYYSAFAAAKPTFFFLEAQEISGLKVTNTTYAALSMKDGDAYSKKFGGTTGNDADWFKVTFTGSLGSQAKGSVDFYLADFRADQSGDDYIVDTWQWVDLSSLGKVDQIEISMASSDVGTYGINTPTYVAIDDLTLVPEPASLALFGLASLAMLRRRK